MRPTLSIVPPPEATPGSAAPVVNGHVNGHTYRLPDKLPQEPRPAPGHTLTDGELDSITEAFKPWTAVLKAQEANEQAQSKCRRSDDLAQRAKLPDLAAQAEVLKDHASKTRGTARLAVLDSIEAAARRAGAKYQAAAHMLAETAAELEGLASLRDLLLGRSDFDPLGIWARSAVLAPPVQYRPRGWSVTQDAWGRDCLWTGSAPGHANAVRRTQAQAKTEIEQACNGAPWPFNN
jgi:hypothetical protein